LTLIFYARKLQIKVYKHCTTVHWAYAYHYVLLITTRPFDLAIPIFHSLVYCTDLIPL
jgi:hypothetical protein